MPVSSELRKAVGAAIFDPGTTEGYKGDRTLTEWQLDAVMRALAAAALDAQGTQWQPMSEAKKDGTEILLLMKTPIPREDRPDLRHWDGIAFVGRHPGVLADGFDIGWNFAAPVGHGGFPDDWFVGWLPLPAAPQPSTGR